MRGRKHTAWKKNRRFSEVRGGRSHPKITDGIFRRLHSLQPPGEGVEIPICIEDNPSRDYYFPLGSAECLEALSALPGRHVRGLTHLWLRRPSGVDRKRGLPFAEFIYGSGVRLIVVYPWRVDRRLCLGRRQPAGKQAREYEKFGARILRDRGWWYAEFDEGSLREFSVHVLYHEVGHHIDAYGRRWSAANIRQCENAADSYAVRFHRHGQEVLCRMQGDADAL